MKIGYVMQFENDYSQHKCISYEYRGYNEFIVLNKMDCLLTYNLKDTETICKN